MGNFISMNVVSTLNKNRKASKKEYLHYDFDEMIDRVDGEESFISELIAMGLPDTESKIGQLRHFLQNHDWRSIRHTAHSMKGIARSLSFKTLALYAESIEELTKIAAEKQHERKMVIDQNLSNSISDLIEKLEKELAFIKTMDFKSSY